MMNYTAVLYLCKTDSVQTEKNKILSKVIFKAVTLPKLPIFQNRLLSAENFVQWIPSTPGTTAQPRRCVSGFTATPQVLIYTCCSRAAQVSRKIMCHQKEKELSRKQKWGNFHLLDFYNSNHAGLAPHQRMMEFRV